MQGEASVNISETSQFSWRSLFKDSGSGYPVHCVHEESSWLQVIAVYANTCSLPLYTAEKITLADNGPEPDTEPQGPHPYL
jgi:hypothetical protein